MNDYEERFAFGWDYLSGEVHINAIRKGFSVEGVERNKAEQIALIHSELSEALEDIRRGGTPDDKCPNFSNETIELADAVIRIMDYGREHGLDIGGAIVAKHAYNKTRPYKHGKEF